MTVAKFFSCRNIALFWTCMILILSYFLYTPIPKGFSEPWKLQIMLASMKTISFLGVVSESVGYRSRLNISRSLLNVACRPIQSSPELQVTNTLFDGVPVRIYKPSGLKTPVPAMIYFHGGGWCSLGLDHYDVLTSQIAKKANIIVVSVEYRLAPEHPFPIPFDDCVTATLHLLQESSRYGVDSKRVAIGGDSAGGNLAAAVAQRLSMEPEHFVPRLKLQLLLYPMLQVTDFNLPSYRQNNGMGGIVSKTDLIYFWMMYLGIKDLCDYFPYFANNSHTTSLLKQSEYGGHTATELLPVDIQKQAVAPDYRDDHVNFELASRIEDVVTNPFCAPLMASNLSLVPQAYIVSAEFDMLRDEGLIYGERLRRQGVKVQVTTMKSAFHGIFNMMDGFLDFELALQALNDIVQYLKQEL